jgi:hypothetical protein
MSTIHAALEGARRFARGAPLDEYFETWLPDPTKDRAASRSNDFARQDRRDAWVIGAWRDG